MPLFAQVKNGLVVNVWDSPPPVAVGEDGWVDAVMIDPVVVPGRQRLGTGYQYDIDKNPLEIRQNVEDISVDERKALMQAENKHKFTEFVDYSQKNAALYTQQEILDRRNVANSNKTAIDNCTTHDQLDALVLQEIAIF